MPGICITGAGVPGTGALTTGVLVTGVLETTAGALACGFDTGSETSPTEVTTAVDLVPDEGCADGCDELGHGAPCEAEVLDDDDPGQGCDCGLAGAVCTCVADGLLLLSLCGFWFVGYRGEPT